MEATLNRPPVELETHSPGGKLGMTRTHLSSTGWCLEVATNFPDVPPDSRKVVSIKGVKVPLFSQPFASVHFAGVRGAFCCINGYYKSAGFSAEGYESRKTFSVIAAGHEPGLMLEGGRTFLRG